MTLDASKLITIAYNCSKLEKPIYGASYDARRIDNGAEVPIKIPYVSSFRMEYWDFDLILSHGMAMLVELLPHNDFFGYDYSVKIEDDENGPKVVYNIKVVDKLLQQQEKEQ